MSEPVDFFELFSLTFRFRALDPFVFPVYLTGNIFRGALGSFLQSANRTAYDVLFGAAGHDVPVLRADPRPFVLRCRDLDGCRYSPGEIFSLHLNLFRPDLDLVEPLTAALTAMSDAGFGPTRSRAELPLPPEHVHRSLRFDEPLPLARKIVVRFHTPTEFKSNGEVLAPGSFSVLSAQICTRLNRLSSLYGSGELSLDQKLLRTKAASITLLSTDLRSVKVSRRGTRSGRTHSLGGFVGAIEYSGCDLAPFLPLLQAASFTGVGRHTVWGNGELSVEIVA